MRLLGVRHARRVRIVREAATGLRNARQPAGPVPPEPGPIGPPPAVPGSQAPMETAPGGRPRESGPRLPDIITAQQLDPDARAQLNSLPNDLADTVARYLVAAGMAEDPERGYEYALAARRLAARVGVVREAVGIAAYRAGRWAEALSELRAARRLTGREDYLPVMADCERALGRLDRALSLIREADTSTLDRAAQIELRIVESGIRRDQGLAAAAVIALQVPELTGGRLRPWSARLFYAYADALLAAGRAEEARDAFARAAAADPDGETDAADRLDELDGIEFEDLADYEDEDLAETEDEDHADHEDEDHAATRTRISLNPRARGTPRTTRYEGRRASFDSWSRLWRMPWPSRLMTSIRRSPASYSRYAVASTGTGRCRQAPWNGTAGIPPSTSAIACCHMPPSS